MRRLLQATALALALLGGTAAASDAPGPPGTYALTPAQVGPGYELRLRPDTRCVKGCPTLDLCKRTFPSEGKRRARHQVDYVGRGAAVRISSEIVTYRPGAGAPAAFELARAAATCPRTPVPSHERGISPLTYRLKRLHDARLLPGAVALQVRVTGKNGGLPFDNTLVAVYQFRGDVFSGIYAYPGFGITVADQIKAGLRAAAAAAANLRSR